MSKETIEKIINVRDKVDGKNVLKGSLFNYSYLQSHEFVHNFIVFFI